MTETADNLQDARDRLICALDVATRDEALALFAMLRDEVGMFKIGSQLFTACGESVVREIVDAGGRVFLDLKFHDIPNTVAAACRAATKLGVSLLNVHASGGAEMMRRAAEAVRSEIDVKSTQMDTAMSRLFNKRDERDFARTKLIGVTVLTSADVTTLTEIGVESNVDEQVARLAKLAASCSLDGVVASPREIALIRSVVARQDFLIATPGVRPASSSNHDQKRVATPFAAVRAGADYIVVGRAIIEQADPLQAARQVVREIAEALNESAMAEDVNFAGQTIES